MTRMSRSRAGRAAQLGGLVGTEAARHAVHRTAAILHAPGGDPARARDALLAERIVTVLGGMRGLAMKFGQMLSIVDPGMVEPQRRDLFQAVLADLQDNAPAVPWHQMRGLLEQELGNDLDAAFAEFDREPVAAASIGQVYRARLHDGRQVAVKAQYPGIADAVAADLKNLRMLMSVYRLLHPALDTATLANEIEERMREELDYRIEAAHTIRLAAGYRAHPFIRIPRVINELSGHRVLVTEWFEGRPLRAAYDAPQAARDRLAEILFRFYGGTPYLLHLYSGDPHPGNVVLFDDGGVGFLDFGLCKAVEPMIAAAELAALRAGIGGDADRIVELMEARGFASRSEVFPQEAYEIFTRVFGWYLRDEEAEITPEVATDLVALLGFGGGADGASVRAFNLPAEHVLRGRADLQLAAMLGGLRPRANLHAIAREWIFDEPPRTELGRAHRDWRHHRDGSAPSIPPTSEICQSEPRSTVIR
ncbi:ABC1 kinase family protein [Nocardia brasiliensis]|uniref:ABC1 kinase family protein n=1 Tax=Nocardia brasiliensis TaxID=37326 RepID=UPI0009DD0123|nr:AarF/ABC1/UbiB kinase family protein [Nocardia brasiliensis]